MIQPRFLESAVFDTIEGRAVNEFADGHPLGRPFVQSLMARCPVVICLPKPEGADEPLPYNDGIPQLNGANGFYLELPSEAHGRSFELLGNSIPDEWQDPYGNIYRSLSLKGINFIDPQIIKSDTASDGYIPHGLQESVVVGRVNRASDILASRGISTEYVFGIAEPDVLPWPIIESGVDASTMIGKIGYRQHLIERYFADHQGANLDSDQISQMLGAIGEMSFFFTLRATDSAYRMGDLKSDFQREQVFSHFNHNLLPQGEQPLDPDEPADLHRFVTTVIAPKLGEYIALMHPDLAHRFLHSFNITALGGIVDLDSVHGTALEIGDKPITDQDRALDIITALSSISDVYANDLPHKLLTSQIDITPHLVLLESYFDKAESILGSREAALSYKARLIESMMEQFSQYGGDHEAELIEVLDRLEYQLVTEYLGYLGISVQGAAAVVRREIHALSDPDYGPIYSLLAHEFKDRLEFFASVCVGEFINDTINADRRGETFNAFEAFVQCENRENTETWQVIQKEIRSLFESALALQLSEKEPIKTLLPDEIARISVICHMFRRMARGKDEETLRVNELIKSLIEFCNDDMEAATQYDIPVSHFARGQSFLDIHGIGHQSNSYWRNTENVSFDDAMEVFTKADEGFATIEELNFVGGSLQIRITPSIGAVIEEIAFDVGTSGASKSDKNDHIELSFDDLPSYVLVIEKLPDGNRRYRMLWENVNDSANYVTDQAYSLGVANLNQLSLFDNL